MGVKVDIVKAKKDYVSFFANAVGGGGGIKARFTDSRLAECA